MNTTIKSFFMSLLCLCLSAILFCSCSFPDVPFFSKKENEATPQNHSELTETESFPVKLEIAQNSYIIPSKPHRLVVLSADLIQALEDIGVASLICGVSDNAPSGVSVSGAKVCGTALNADCQQIITEKPDWVLVSSQMRQNQMDELAEQGIGVITFSRPQNINEIKTRYRQLFTLCYGSEGTARADEFLTNYQQKLDNAISPASGYAKLANRKSVVYLAQPDYTMATGESFEGQMLDMIGLYNLGELGSRWKYPEVETEVLTPEIIFYDQNLPQEQIFESEIYAQSPAALSGQLYPIDFTAVRMQGLPMIDELAKIAKAAYPQAYGE